MMQGETQIAKSVVARALKLSSTEGYVKTYIELGEPMLELIVALSRSQAAEELHLDRSYLGEIVAAFFPLAGESAILNPMKMKAGHEPDVIPGVLVEPLTTRELMVLRLIVAEQNNREIARALAISVNTVKTHTASIYSKLGVHNRLEAANRAHLLGLL
jgi:LuxR family maltose regulon positive regulatory protein